MAAPFVSSREIESKVVRMNDKHEPAAARDDPFAGIDIPPPLQASLRRHREHLARLVANLRSVGLDQASIEASVSVIVESYRTELLGAIRSMMETGNV